MSMGYSQFREVCEAQGVQLSPEVIRDYEKTYKSKRNLLTNFTSFIGRLLNDSPEGRLASRPVQKTWTRDTGADILREMIGASIEPVTETGLLRLDVRVGGGAVSCPSSEPRFAKTFMRYRDFPEVTRLGVDVFTNEGTPVFVRKSIKIPSAISLLPIVLNGIPYPGGSIFGLETEEDLERGYTKVPPVNPRERSLDQIVTATFMRLSAFSFPVEERQEAFGIKLDGAIYEDGQREFIDTVNMVDLRNIAQDMCPPIEDAVGHR